MAYFFLLFLVATSSFSLDSKHLKEQKTKKMWQVGKKGVKNFMRLIYFFWREREMAQVTQVTKKVENTTCLHKSSVTR